jgi:VanZ family protein
MRPVLFGGRTAPHVKTFTGWLLSTWLPVFIMLLIIARESTPMFSSDNTSPFFRVLYQAIYGPVQDWQWPPILHSIRKSFHFIGYGTLGLTWLRGWMIFWVDWLRHRSVWLWRGYCAAMGMACTAVVASLDELHQSFLPSRTGMPSDVLLDCCGAAVFILFCATFWIRRPWQRTIQ